MTDTYTTKEYAKAKKAWSMGIDPTGLSKYWDLHRFHYHKTPSESKNAKLVIQTMGHKRRRAREREAFRAAVKLDIYANNFDIELWDVEGSCNCCECMLEYYYNDHEDYDYEKYLPKNAKRHSNVWDYY